MPALAMRFFRPCCFFSSSIFFSFFISSPDSQAFALATFPIFILPEYVSTVPSLTCFHFSSVSRDSGPCKNSRVPFVFPLWSRSPPHPHLPFAPHPTSAQLCLHCGQVGQPNYTKAPTLAGQPTQPRPLPPWPASRSTFRSASRSNPEAAPSGRPVGSQGRSVARSVYMVGRG